MFLSLIFHSPPPIHPSSLVSFLHSKLPPQSSSSVLETPYSTSPLPPPATHSTFNHSFLHSHAISLVTFHSPPLFNTPHTLLYHLPLIVYPSIFIKNLPFFRYFQPFPLSLASIHKLSFPTPELFFLSPTSPISIYQPPSYSPTSRSLFLFFSLLYFHSKQPSLLYPQPLTLNLDALVLHSLRLWARAFLRAEKPRL